MRCCRLRDCIARQVNRSLLGAFPSASNNCFRFMHVLVQHMSANGDHLSAESFEWSACLFLTVNFIQSYIRVPCSDLDAAAAAAAAMGLEMPTPAPSKSVPKLKDSKSNSGANSKGKSSEADNDKRREDLRATGGVSCARPFARALSRFCSSAFRFKLLTILTAFEFECLGAYVCSRGGNRWCRCIIALCLLILNLCRAGADTCKFGRRQGPLYYSSKSRRRSCL